jgi:hypothetical protein
MDNEPNIIVCFLTRITLEEWHGNGFGAIASEWYEEHNLRSIKHSALPVIATSLADLGYELRVVVDAPSSNAATAYFYPR